jgi:putative oxygen-independent coproporphyrinogen III oxidase
MIHLQTVPEAVYIHIPFCTNKCYYCDFNSYVLKGQPVESYLHAMEKEMELTVEVDPPAMIRTVFVGGGTPTVLTPGQMEQFLGLVQRYFPNRDAEFEFTMEANPGTTDLDKLKVMKAGGVNRISFGVQSFNNQLLSRIGRIHSTDDVYLSIENARKAGFDNISIDLMYGLPDQTLDMLEDSISAALALELQHYSIYGLKVEENTLFHTLYEKGKLPLPEEEIETNMYMRIMERLKQAGYVHYEISNYAKPGKESRHNTVYWKNESYYGIGAGAHGYVKGVRHVNVKGVQAYIEAVQAGLPRVETTPVSREEAQEDFMMVGLRLLQGVKREDYYRQFGEQIEEAFAGEIEKLVGKGLLEATSDGYRLTHQGIFLGNEVFAEFLS